MFHQKYKNTLGLDDMIWCIFWNWETVNEWWSYRNVSFWLINIMSKIKTQSCSLIHNITCNGVILRCVNCMATSLKLDNLYFLIVYMVILPTAWTHWWTSLVHLQNWNWTCCRFHVCNSVIAWTEVKSHNFRTAWLSFIHSFKQLFYQ